MTDTAMGVTAPQQDTAHTSLAQLFGATINGTQVKAIEIPLFQRDYAQGRENDQAGHVRQRFIADLCNALDGNQILHLDFVFGDVVDGTLYPLDGQQRLTTLFLLHCYLAWCLPETAGVVQPWHEFHYATRPGARAFCQFLTQCRPDMSEQILSDWLCNQAVYLPTWKHDPTIQGMLVVLNALHAQYRNQSVDQLRTAWQRLIDPQRPAISFLLLPVAAQKLDNTLYIKMNSRGRPLTEFENFKADLEALLHKNPAIPKETVDLFSHNIDTDWADLFWQYRDDNNLIDEESLRYLRFLFEVQAWKRGIPVNTRHNDLQAVDAIAKPLFGNGAQHAKEDFNWMVQALDVWLESDASGVRKPKAVGRMFSELFTREASSATTPLRVFNFGEFGDTPVDVNLLHACCKLYGTRSWSLPHTLLLYGVLQGFMDGMSGSDLQQRLRLLRNLIEASRNEIRADGTRNNMLALLHEVDIIMAAGKLTSLAGVNTFNQVQVRNEREKQALVATHAALQEVVNQLEDHELLRGGLTAFDLSTAQGATAFASRAAQFPRLFESPYSLVSAALLAKGNQGRGYVRPYSDWRLVYLGAPRSRQSGLWEDHWRARRNENPHPSAAALAALLDDMAAGRSPQTVVDAFIVAPNTIKDWRYYIAKFPAMREQPEFAGSYVVAPGHGYAICMLKSDSCDDRSNHCDAYLLALAQEVPEVLISNEGWPRCFPGYETNERHLKLHNSGIQIRCLDAGWQFSSLPDDVQQCQVFEDVAKRHSSYQDKHQLYAIPQHNGVDTEDRIELGSKFLRELVEAGL